MTPTVGERVVSRSLFPDEANMDSCKQRLRMNIRNFFMTANKDELEAALPNYPDQFSKGCILELIAELTEFTIED